MKRKERAEDIPVGSPKAEWNVHVNLILFGVMMRVRRLTPLNPNTPQFVGVIVCGVDYNGL